MVTLDTISALIPAVLGSLALLGYAALLAQKRRQQQAKSKPIPVRSRRRHPTEEDQSNDVL